MWTPAPGTTWQWQLTTPVDLSVAAAVYDIDLFDNDQKVVAALHARGRKAVCYMEVGAWESYRPDAARFPAAVLGRQMPGYPEERYLDIRRIDILGPIMKARLDQCRAKGFDGVEPDIDDSYFEGPDATGFPLAYGDQVAYTRFIARAAHERGLSIGLKNGADERFIRDVLPFVDWALVESCMEYNECGLLKSFVQAGKAVFHVEYSGKASSFCPYARSLGFSSMRKNVDLDASREPC